MNFWIFMICICFAMIFGAAAERAKNKMNTNVSKNKKYEYADVCFKDLDAPRSAMKELARIGEKNGVIRVYDYYLICGVTAESKDTRYGWKSIADFKIEPHQDKFVLHVPEPRLLEK